MFPKKRSQNPVRNGNLQTELSFALEKLFSQFISRGFVRVYGSNFDGLC